jgi:hypothetical protein
MTQCRNDPSKDLSKEGTMDGATERTSRCGPAPGDAPEREHGEEHESGSLVTEYGLLAVVAATVAGVLIQWATGGAIINLFNALVDRARELVGA